jgi:hypothetical protein
MSAATRHPSLDELSAWADGEIADEVERRLLDEHVSGCPSCASLVADFRALASAQAAAPVPAVPPRLAERVRAALRDEGRGRRRGRRFVLPLSAAATLLVGVVALWLVRHRPETENLSVALERAPARDTAATAPSAPAAPLPELQEPPPATAPTQAPANAGARPAPERKQKALEPSPAPEPGAAPQGVEGGVPGGVLGGVLGGVAEGDAARGVGEEERQRRVSMRDQGFQHARWSRVSPLSRKEEAAARAEAPAAAAPSAEAAPAEPIDRLAATVGADSCPTLDALEPALSLAGLDAEGARRLAERARDAGALSSATDGAARLTLLLPAGAWPRVREILREAGVLVPPAVEAAPAGAACLSVSVVPATP